MENYLMDQCVFGEGAHGTVYKVKSLKTGQEFAMKRYNHGISDATVRELSCLAALRGHPIVIQMHDCFVDDGKIVMLMPFVPYTLSQAIHNRHGLTFYSGEGQVEPISVRFVAHFSVQVAHALLYMHRKNIIHRDLTPFNVLLTENFTVKVADMGLSRQSAKCMSTTAVTEPYRAPELFVDSGFSEYTSAIDMWSLGVMVADAMEGRIVFSPCNKKESTYQIILRTLCPRDHPSAPSSIPCNPETLMPNLIGCNVVKRIVFRLLAFRDNERLLAHDMLQDKEWNGLARMTEEDKVLVRKRLQGTKD
ncbi:cell division control protein 2 homolog 3-like [Betta splendens]|uniref:Cell division control protein 2 homolog 3-like n=1 Tax=Betta splendens TaxID=158456 RepID=A0A6P7LTS4_BETSP|nr:cell division control protein 2 homolog 3-like [Betta splendens]